MPPPRKFPPIADALRNPGKEPPPERFKLCPECGQTYDSEHLGETYHHTLSGPHEPLPPNA